MVFGYVKPNCIQGKLFLAQAGKPWVRNRQVTVTTKKVTITVTPIASRMEPKGNLKVSKGKPQKLIRVFLKLVAPQMPDLLVSCREPNQASSLVDWWGFDPDRGEVGDSTLSLKAEGILFRERSLETSCGHGSKAHPPSCKSSEFRASLFSHSPQRFIGWTRPRET